MYLLVVDPGGSQCLLELGEAHNVNVDELDHLITLSRAAGLVPHNLPHDPGDKSLDLKSTLNRQIEMCQKSLKMLLAICVCILFN